ncbi:MAG: hypothetical protein R8P61_32725 [Bacteroidia bacterium]|nr:hypothetical protein [Bacteroidia bacterium]
MIIYNVCNRANPSAIKDLRPAKDGIMLGTQNIVTVENKTKESVDASLNVKVKVPGSTHSISLTQSKNLETGDAMTLITSFSGDKTNTAGVFSSYSIDENGNIKAKAGLKVQSPKVKVGKTTFSGSIEGGLSSEN